MDFLRRRFPRVYQAVQDALDFFTNITAQAFGAPPNAAQPRNARPKVPIQTPEHAEEVQAGGEQMTVVLTSAPELRAAKEENGERPGDPPDHGKRHPGERQHLKQEATEDKDDPKHLHTTSDQTDHQKECENKITNDIDRVEAIVVHQSMEMKSTTSTTFTIHQQVDTTQHQDIQENEDSIVYGTKISQNDTEIVLISSLRDSGDAAHKDGLQTDKTTSVLFHQFSSSILSSEVSEPLEDIIGLEKLNVGKELTCLSEIPESQGFTINVDREAQLLAGPTSCSVLMEEDHENTLDVTEGNKKMVTPASETENSPYDPGKETRKTWEDLVETAVRLAKHCDSVEEVDSELETSEDQVETLNEDSLEDWASSGDQNKPPTLQEGTPQKDVSERTSYSDKVATGQSRDNIKEHHDKWDLPTEKLEVKSQANNSKNSKPKRRVHFSPSTEDMFKKSEGASCKTYTIMPKDLQEEIFQARRKYSKRLRASSIEEESSFYGVSEKEDFLDNACCIQDDPSSEMNQTDVTSTGRAVWYDECPVRDEHDDETCKSLVNLESFMPVLGGKVFEGHLSSRDESKTLTSEQHEEEVHGFQGMEERPVGKYINSDKLEHTWRNVFLEEKSEEDGFKDENTTSVKQHVSLTSTTNTTEEEITTAKKHFTIEQDIFSPNDLTEAIDDDKDTIPTVGIMQNVSSDVEECTKSTDRLRELGLDGRQSGSEVLEGTLMEMSPQKQERFGKDQSLGSRTHGQPEDLDRGNNELSEAKQILIADKICSSVVENAIREYLASEEEENKMRRAHEEESHNELFFSKVEETQDERSERRSDDKDFQAESTMTEENGKIVSGHIEALTEELSVAGEQFSFEASGETNEALRISTGIHEEYTLKHEQGNLKIHEEQELSMHNVEEQGTGHLVYETQTYKRKGGPDEEVEDNLDKIIESSTEQIGEDQSMVKHTSSFMMEDEDNEEELQIASSNDTVKMFNDNSEITKDSDDKSFLKSHDEHDLSTESGGLVIDHPEETLYHTQTDRVNFVLDEDFNQEKKATKIEVTSGNTELSAEQENWIDEEQSLAKIESSLIAKDENVGEDVSSKDIFKDDPEIAEDSHKSEVESGHVDLITEYSAERGNQNDEEQSMANIESSLMTKDEENVGKEVESGDVDLVTELSTELDNQKDEEQSMTKTESSLIAKDEENVGEEDVSSKDIFKEDPEIVKDSKKSEEESGDVVTELSMEQDNRKDEEQSMAKIELSFIVKDEDNIREVKDVSSNNIFKDDPEIYEDSNKSGLESGDVDLVPELSTERDNQKDEEQSMANIEPSFIDDPDVAKHSNKSEVESGHVDLVTELSIEQDNHKDGELSMANIDLSFIVTDEDNIGEVKDISLNGLLSDDVEMSEDRSDMAFDHMDKPEVASADVDKIIESSTEQGNDSEEQLIVRNDSFTTLDIDNEGKTITDFSNVALLEHTKECISKPEINEEHEKHNLSNFIEPEPDIDLVEVVNEIQSNVGPHEDQPSNVTMSESDKMANITEHSEYTCKFEAESTEMDGEHQEEKIGPKHTDTRDPEMDHVVCQNLRNTDTAELNEDVDRLTNISESNLVPGMHFADKDHVGILESATGKDNQLEEYKECVADEYESNTEESMDSLDNFQTVISEVNEGYEFQIKQDKEIQQQEQDVSSDVGSKQEWENEEVHHTHSDEEPGDLHGNFDQPPRVGASDIVSGSNSSQYNQLDKEKETGILFKDFEQPTNIIELDNVPEIGSANLVTEFTMVKDIQLDEEQMIDIEGFTVEKGEDHARETEHVSSSEILNIFVEEKEEYILQTVEKGEDNAQETEHVSSGEILNIFVEEKEEYTLQTVDKGEDHAREIENASSEILNIFVEEKEEYPFQTAQDYREIIEEEIQGLDKETEETHQPLTMQDNVQDQLAKLDILPELGSTTGINEFSTGEDNQLGLEESYLFSEVLSIPRPSLLDKSVTKEIDIASDVKHTIDPSPSVTEGMVVDRSIDPSLSLLDKSVTEGMDIANVEYSIEPSPSLPNKSVTMGMDSVNVECRIEPSPSFLDQNLYILPETINVVLDSEHIINQDAMTPQIQLDQNTERESDQEIERRSDAVVETSLAKDKEPQIKLDLLSEIQGVLSPDHNVCKSQEELDPDRETDEVQHLQEPENKDVDLGPALKSEDLLSDIQPVHTKNLFGKATTHDTPERLEEFVTKHSQLTLCETTREVVQWTEEKEERVGSEPEAMLTQQGVTYELGKDFKGQVLQDDSVSGTVIITTSVRETVTDFSMGISLASGHYDTEDREHIHIKSEADIVSILPASENEIMIVVDKAEHPNTELRTEQQCLPVIQRTYHEGVGEDVPDQKKTQDEEKELMDEPAVQEDEMDSSMLSHNTLDVSMQKSRVQLRRKTSVRRRQGPRPATLEMEPPELPPEMPKPEVRPRIMGVPIFPKKMPVPPPAAAPAPVTSHPANEPKEEKTSSEELEIKPKKGFLKHGGFGIPHPQMMQELQARLHKKKPKE